MLARSHRCSSLLCLTLLIHTIRCLNGFHIRTGVLRSKRNVGRLESPSQECQSPLSEYGWSATFDSTFRNRQASKHFRLFGRNNRKWNGPRDPMRRTSRIFLRDLLQQLIRRVSRGSFRIRKALRRITERSTIYVLACEDDTFYVGMTQNRKQRYQQHFSQRRSGSVWTTLHPPIRVHEEYRRIPSRLALGWEAQVTAQYMWKHGVNRVRGAMYSQRREFHQGDLEEFVAFLGHFNNLKYRDVRSRLERSLPPDPRKLSFSKGERLLLRDDVYTSDTRWKTRQKCFNCGKLGHIAADCKKASQMSRRKCYQCGQYGHYAAQCPTNTNETADKDPISTSTQSRGVATSVELAPVCDICGETGHAASDCGLLSWEDDSF